MGEGCFARGLFYYSFQNQAFKLISKFLIFLLVSSFNNLYSRLCYCLLSNIFVLFFVVVVVVLFQALSSDFIQQELSDKSSHKLSFDLI